MPLLTVTNLRTSPISLQDPSGLSGVSFTVPGSSTVTDKVLSLSALAAIEPQLILESTAANITLQTSDDPASSADVLPDHIKLVLTSPYTAVPGDQDLVTNLSAAGVVSVVLSAAAKIGQVVNVTDGKGDAGVNNVTITVAGGGTINGGANLVLSANRQRALLLKISTTAWLGHRITV